MKRYSIIAVIIVLVCITGFIMYAGINKYADYSKTVFLRNKELAKFRENRKNKKLTEDKANAAVIVKELNNCRKIEIRYQHTPRVITIDGKDRIASDIIDATQKQLGNYGTMNEEWAGLITSHYIYFYVSDDTAYEAMFDTESPYFEIYTKVRTKKDKEEMETIQQIHISFTELPSDFLNTMRNSLHQAEREYPDIEPKKE